MPLPNCMIPLPVLSPPLQCASDIRIGMFLLHDVRQVQDMNLDRMALFERFIFI